MTNYHNEKNNTPEKNPQQESWQNPYVLEGGNPPSGGEPRHRRGDKYDLLDEDAPSPSNQVDPKASAFKLFDTGYQQNDHIDFENDDYMDEDDEDDVL